MIARVVGEPQKRWWGSAVGQFTRWPWGGVFVDAALESTGLEKLRKL